MPAVIEITDDRLVVQIEGADRLWALRGRLEVPLANVVDVAPAAAQAREWLHGVRLGGTHIPGVISAGRSYEHGKWVFWDVHDPEHAIGIQLRDEKYDQLVVEVADPEDAITRIRRAAAG